MACISTSSLLAAILLDGTSAGLLACKRVWPKLPVLNDARHVQAAVRRVRHEVCSSTALKTYLSGEVHFAAGLSSRLLFHRFWTAMLIDLLLADHDKLVEYIRGHLLTWDTEARSWIYIIHMLNSTTLVMLVGLPVLLGYTVKIHTYIHTYIYIYTLTWVTKYLTVRSGHPYVSSALVPKTSV